MNTVETVFDELVAMLRDFDGREFSGAIERESWFFADLGLASIDAVIFGEKLEARFGRKLAFGKALADLARAGRDDFQIGEVADFVCRQVNHPESD